MSTDGKTQMRVSRTAKNDGGGTRTHSVSDGMGASLFEVSPEDIASLEPVDLWELVARLCQVTLADAGLPTMCVTHGGHLSAPDGGIDVRVQLRKGDLPPTKLPLRLAAIGFQVKATKMGVGEIESEMLKGGKLRPSIEKLIEGGGGYIIATSDSAPDEEYNKRLKKMRDCVDGVLKSGQEVHVAYCDRKVLAAWVNDYPSVVPWVRLKTKGSVLNGWEPYGQWASSKRISDREYPPFLPDKKARFIDSCNPGRALNLIDGVERVRDVLREGGKSVRLVGLSGVGKTRFVQALFETDVGSCALDKELVVYADVGRGTSPSPTFVLDKLISEKKKTILVIDNCSPSLHRELVGRIEGGGSGEKVSLLTVEYDIREDIPYETRVFRLEGGSVELIEGIVRTQFPDISQVDVNTIARFSEGNSRIAVALASSVEQKDSLADLSDAELLDRLLLQRNDSNEEIRRVAEACSLVYSFNGEDIHGELERLAALAVVSPNLLYRHVVTLESRGLVQRRDVWRAVLPPAISNRLATDALRFMPYASIKEQIEEAIPGSGDPARLLRSFSRRLGYLNESEEARGIVNGWLLPGGVLDQVRESGGASFYMELLANVAPVNPEGAVYFIERLMKLGQIRSAIESVSDSDALCMTGSDLNDARLRLLLLLRSLAYDPILFDRCLDIIMVFAVAEKGVLGVARRVIGSLFLIEFSGTHAKTDQRLEWLERRLRSSDESIRSIACCCLRKALKSRRFESDYGFNFGARKRDFGWSPFEGEREDWFEKFINLTIRVAGGSSSILPEVKSILAYRFRDLWEVAEKAKGVKEKLCCAAESFSETGWEEGWVAIRVTIRFDREKMGEESRNALLALDRLTSPKDLLSRMRVLVRGNHLVWDISGGQDSSDWYRDGDRMAQKLGQELAQKADLLHEAANLVTGPDAVSSTYDVGKGLASYALDMENVWWILVGGFMSWQERKRNPFAMKGYLEGVFERDVRLSNKLLNEAAEKPRLRNYVPFLQSSLPLDDQGCGRLLALMKRPDVGAMSFLYVLNGPPGEKPVDGSYPDFYAVKILEGLLGREGGASVAIQALNFYVSERESVVEKSLSEVAYKLLERVILDIVNGDMGLLPYYGLVYPVERVIKFFLGPAAGVGVEEREVRARHIMQCVMDVVGPRLIFPVPDFDKILKAFCGVQGKVVLDFMVADDDGVGAGCRRFNLRQEWPYGDGDNPLIEISVDTLLQWCQSKGSVCWVNAANAVPVILPVKDDGAESRWQWSLLAVSLLNSAPNPCMVAEALVKRIRPDSLVGVTSQLLMERLPLLDRLFEMLGSKCSEKMEGWRNELLDKIDDEKKREAREEAARQKEQARFE